MWQAKYASAVPKNLVVDFRPCSEDDFLTGRLQSVTTTTTMVPEVELFLFVFWKN